MSLIVKKSDKKRQLIPEGNYVARCYQMIEIGTVNDAFKGIQKQVPKIRIGWELPTELRVFDEAKGEQPLVISKEYNFTLNEKSNLRIMLASWLGKDFTEKEDEGFDVTELVGLPCMLNVIHKHKISDPNSVYEDISSVTPIPKGIRPLKRILPAVVLLYDKFDQEKFDSLPDFIKQKMIGSLEYAALKNPNSKQMKEPATMSDPENDLSF